MKRLLVIFLLAASSCPALSQPTSDESQVTPVMPITPVVLPPDVPPRPPLIAVPPTVADMNVSTQPMQKESLAWRARAHKLRLSNTAAQQILSTNYDAAIMTLIGALSQCGLRVQTLNSKAGELLAVPIDVKTTQKYIFVIAEMPPGTVTIKATSWSQTNNAAALIDTILQSLRGKQ